MLDRFPTGVAHLITSIAPLAPPRTDHINNLGQHTYLDSAPQSASPL
jgi:hypothetical protein